MKWVTAGANKNVGGPPGYARGDNPRASGVRGRTCSEWLSGTTMPGAAGWWYEVEFEVQPGHGWIQAGPGRFFHDAADRSSVDTHLRGGKVTGAFVTVKKPDGDAEAAMTGKFRHCIGTLLVLRMKKACGPHLRASMADGSVRPRTALSSA